VANELAKAKLFEYYFWYFFMSLITRSTAKDMMGVRTRINSVNFQLIIHRKIKLPKNCKKFLRSMERLSEQTE